MKERLRIILRQCLRWVLKARDAMKRSTGNTHAQRWSNGIMDVNLSIVAEISMSRFR